MVYRLLETVVRAPSTLSSSFCSNQHYKSIWCTIYGDAVAAAACAEDLRGDSMIAALWMTMVKTMMMEWKQTVEITLIVLVEHLNTLTRVLLVNIFDSKS